MEIKKRKDFLLQGNDSEFTKARKKIRLQISIGIKKTFLML